LILAILKNDINELLLPDVLATFNIPTGIEKYAIDFSQF
jgi:hypothetical protein